MKGGRGKEDERGGLNVGPKFKGLQGEGMWHLIAVAKRQYRVRRAINELTQRWTRRSIRKSSQMMLRPPELDSNQWPQGQECPVLKYHEKKNRGRMGRNRKIALTYRAPDLARMLAENRQKKGAKGRRAGIGEFTMFGK